MYKCDVSGLENVGGWPALRCLDLFCCRNLSTLLLWEAELIANCILCHSHGSYGNHGRSPYCGPAGALHLRGSLRSNDCCDHDTTRRRLQIRRLCCASARPSGEALTSDGGVAKEAVPATVTTPFHFAILVHAARSSLEGTVLTPCFISAHNSFTQFFSSAKRRCAMYVPICISYAHVIPGSLSQNSNASSPLVRVLGCPEGRSAKTWVDFNLFGHQVPRLPDLSQSTNLEEFNLWGVV